MKVRDVYCPDITSAAPNTSIEVVVYMMHLTRYYAIPVVSSENIYMGCIDISDIIDICTPDYIKHLSTSSFLPDINKLYKSLVNIKDKQVGEFLTKDYPVVKPDDSLNYVADLLNKTKRRTIPVIEDKKLIGTISRLELISPILKSSSLI